MYQYKFSFSNDNKNISKIISEMEKELIKEDEIDISEKEALKPLILFEDKGLFFSLKENIYLFSKINIEQ